MTPTCGCKPGTYADGWHEVRSAACLKSERDAFIQAIRRVRDNIDFVLWEHGK